VAKELIFVIDCSGSMSGFPLAKAKDTMAQCIQDLSPRDTFNLISFAGGTGYCFNETKTANEENKRAALRYLENLQGGGGTEMMGAVQAALAGPYAKDRLRTICFMTDGFIGNDMAILDAIRRGAPYARVFSFGIGNSVNRFLIEGMAREGRGAAEVVTLESKGEDAVQRFSARIKRPVLTNISVEFSGVEGADLYPPLNALPDLFAGQPLRITGRYARAGSGAIIVRGETASGPFERKIAVEFPGRAPGHDSLASLWARQRVEALMATDWQGIQEGRPAPDLKKQIIALGTEYSLVTQFTSFIAVDDSSRCGDGKPVQISVPVEMPDGVSYDGIMGNAGSKMRTGGAGGAPGIRALQSAPAPAPPAPMLMRAAPAAAEAKAEPVPAPEVEKSQDMKDVKVDRDSAKSASKLDPALRGLAARLVNGAYTGEGLQVANNQVEVAVYLRDVGDAALSALRALGAEVRSVSHAASKALVRVNVADLEKLAALDAVLRIAPPSR
jgi:Ca-activated chloride channel family protein